MAEVETRESGSNSGWNTTQVYVIAVVCFLLGLPVGYLFHGDTFRHPQPAAQSRPAQAPAATPAAQPQAQPTPEQMKAMADKTAAPLLDQLKKNPKDPVLLANIANVYYDTHQFPEAIRYYSESLKYDPKNPSVRTDMATIYYYMGDVDKALEEMNTSLKYSPNNPQTLMNMGVIKWQSKMDIDGAVAAWEKLLKTNPNFEGAPQVRQLIAQAKQHAGMKPSSDKRM